MKNRIAARLATLTAATLVADRCRADRSGRRGRHP